MANFEEEAKHWTQPKKKKPFLIRDQREWISNFTWVRLFIQKIKKFTNLLNNDLYNGGEQI